MEHSFQYEYSRLEVLVKDSPFSQEGFGFERLLDVQGSCSIHVGGGLEVIVFPEEEGKKG